MLRGLFAAHRSLMGQERERERGRKGEREGYTLQLRKEMMSCARLVFLCCLLPLDDPRREDLHTVEQCFSAVHEDRRVLRCCRAVSRL